MQTLSLEPHLSYNLHMHIIEINATSRFYISFRILLLAFSLSNTKKKWAVQNLTDWLHSQLHNTIAV